MENNFMVTIEFPAESKPKFYWTKDGKPIEDSEVPAPEGANDWHMKWHGPPDEFYWTKDGKKIGESGEKPEGANDWHLIIPKPPKVEG